MSGHLPLLRAQDVRWANETQAETGGTPTQAKIALEAVLARHPADALAWYRLAQLEAQLHHVAAAEQDVRRSIALNPEMPDAHYLLGLSLVADPKAKLDWRGAIAEFRAALKLRPRYANALAYLGVGLTATGQHEDAVKALQQAVEIDPNSASAYFNLALALEPLNRTSEAADAYRRAAALRPRFAEAHSALGKLLFRAGDRDAAGLELREALRLNPDLQDAHYVLGQCLRAQNRLEEAHAEFDLALSLGQREPDGVAASQRSNEALRQAAGDLRSAETMLREAIALRPDYGVPHYNLGLILADGAHWDASISQLAQAASLMLGQAGPWFDLGRVLRRTGRDQEALTCLQWAAALEPSEKRLTELRETAAVLHTSSVTPAATAHPAFGVPAEDVDSYRIYARQLRAQNDLQGAVGMLLHVLALTPAAVDPRLDLADAYTATGDATRSLREYRKVLAVEPHNAVAQTALEHRAPAPGHSGQPVRGHPSPPF